MHERKGGENSYYYIVLYYQGRILRYRLQEILSDRQTGTWWLYFKSGVQELRWHKKEKRLEHITIQGQAPMPVEFLGLLEKEFKEIHA